MTKEEYIRLIKQLIKKYHPDLCRDEFLENEFNEITIKLNNKLNQIENRGEINKNNISEVNVPKNCFQNNSLANIGNQSYIYYKLGIKYYKNIHPDQFYKKNVDKKFIPKTYEEQINILNKIYISFNSAEYYFTKVIMEYPNCEWVTDAKEKIKLLKKLQKSYENMDIEKYNQIVDGNKYVNEMRLKII